MTGPLNPGDHFRAIYASLWRMNERHDLRRARPAHNDNREPLGAA